MKKLFTLAAAVLVGLSPFAPAMAQEREAPPAGQSPSPASSRM